MDLPGICASCGAALQDGSPREVSGRVGAFDVTLRGQAPPICPSGCRVQLDDLTDALGWVMAFSRVLTEHFPKRKGFFRKKDICRACASELVPGGLREGDSFSATLPTGGHLEVGLIGPCLLCTSCGRRYLVRDAGFSRGLMELAGRFVQEAPPPGSGA